LYFYALKVKNIKPGKFRQKVHGIH